MEQDNNLKLQFSLINIFVLFLFAVVVGVISSLTTYSLLSPKLFNQLPSDVIPQTQPQVLPTITPNRETRTTSQTISKCNLVINENSINKLKIDVYLKKLGFDSFNLLACLQNFIWVYEPTIGPGIEKIVKIDVKTSQITKFDVSNLPIQIGEFDLNPTREKIVFSDYPAFFDADSHDEFLKSKKTVNSVVYDLNNRTKQTIATSITKAFNPKWIDENTVEYDNPIGEGRITKIIP